MRDRTDVLVVLDNLDEDYLLHHPIPGLGNERILELGCRLLITSRLQDLPNCKVFQVDCIDPEAAWELLLRESQRMLETIEDEAAFKQILVPLGGHPLALRLVGTILKKNPNPMSDIARELQENGVIAVIDETMEEFAVLNTDELAKVVHAARLDARNQL